MVVKHVVSIVVVVVDLGDRRIDQTQRILGTPNPDDAILHLRVRRPRQSHACTSSCTRVGEVELLRDKLSTVFNLTRLGGIASGHAQR